MRMFDMGNPVHWFFAALLLAGVILLIRQLRPEQRARRRRDRNHGRVVSRINRPTVSLAVKTKPSKKQDR